MGCFFIYVMLITLVCVYVCLSYVQIQIVLAPHHRSRLARLVGTAPHFRGAVDLCRSSRPPLHVVSPGSSKPENQIGTVYPLCSVFGTPWLGPRPPGPSARPAPRRAVDWRMGAVAQMPTVWEWERNQPAGRYAGRDLPSGKTIDT